MLRNIPRRGYQVASITLGDIRSLFEARRIVDPQVGVLVVEDATTEQIADMVALAEHPPIPSDYATAYDTGFMAAGENFHRAIARSCGNARLAQFALHLNDDSQRIRYFQALTGHLAPTCINTHHTELADALQRRDAQEVHRLIVEQTDEEEERSF